MATNQRRIFFFSQGRPTAQVRALRLATPSALPARTLKLRSRQRAGLTAEKIALSPLLHRQMTVQSRIISRLCIRRTARIADGDRCCQTLAWTAGRTLRFTGRQTARQIDADAIIQK